MLRGVFAIVLLVACFPEDSTAGSDDGSPVPGFSFVGTGTPKVAMNAPGGIMSFEDIQNTTAWQPTFREGSASISQDIVFPGMSVVYNNTMASLGLLENNGSFTAGLSSSIYKLILTATGNSSNNSSCLLNIQIDMQCVDPDLSLRNLGLVGQQMQAVSGTLEGLAHLICAYLPNALSIILNEKIIDNIEDTIGRDTLCQNLVDSNSTNFVQPLLK